MLPSVTLFSGLNVLTDWMPRQGDNLIIQFEFVKRFNECDLEIDVIHKDAEEAGNGGALSGSSDETYSSEGRQEYISSVAGGTMLKELVRVRVKALDGSGGMIDPLEQPQWAEFRFLNFIWYDTPNA